MAKPPAIPYNPHKLPTRADWLSPAEFHSPAVESGVREGRSDKKPSRWAEIGKMNIDQRSLVLGIFIGVGFMLVLQFIILLLRPWRHAFFSNAPVPLPQIIGMRLRGNPPLLLIDAYILLRKADVDVQIGYVEVVYIQNKNAIDSPDKLAELVKRYLKDIKN